MTKSYRERFYQRLDELRAVLRIQGVFKPLLEPVVVKVRERELMEAGTVGSETYMQNEITQALSFLLNMWMLFLTEAFNIHGMQHMKLDINLMPSDVRGADYDVLVSELDISYGQLNFDKQEVLAVFAELYSKFVEILKQDNEIMFVNGLKIVQANSKLYLTRRER